MPSRHVETEWCAHDCHVSVNNIGPIHIVRKQKRHIVDPLSPFARRAFAKFAESNPLSPLDAYAIYGWRPSFVKFLLSCW